MRHILTLNIRQVPRVFYSSRTHSQLKQVTKELRKTAYRPLATVVGGREQLCVNPKVKEVKGAKQSAMCAQLCRNTRESKKGSAQQKSSGASGAAGQTCSWYGAIHAGYWK